MCHLSFIIETVTVPDPLHDNPTAFHTKLNPIITCPYAEMASQGTPQRLRPTDGGPIGQTLQDPQHPAVDRLTQGVQVRRSLGRQRDFHSAILAGYADLVKKLDIPPASGEAGSSARAGAGTATSCAHANESASLVP